MDQKKFSNSSPLGEFQGGMRETFRSDQNSREFETAVDKIRQPQEGHSVDRKVGASSSARRGYTKIGKELHEALSDWSVDGLLHPISSRADEGREHRSREIRKEATPKFLSKLSGKRSTSITVNSSTEDDGFGAIVDEAFNLEGATDVKDSEEIENDGR